MAFSPTSPVTGSSETGFTSPTYTISPDLATDVNAKQYAVTAIGGTQTGVIVHSIAAPFTLSFWRPKVARILGVLDSNTGAPRAVPRNVYTLMTRKGVLILANQPYQQATIKTIIDLPAGSDTADPANIRAALSAHIGTLNQVSAGIGDSVINGIL